MSARRTRGALAMPEGFEDVLFGTTGLLTVMLVWALTQIGVPDVSQAKLDELTEALASMTQERDAAMHALGEAKQEIRETKEALQSERRAREAAERAAEQADAARKRAEGAAQKAEQRASELEPKPCDIVFCVDATASQTAVLDSVRTTAITLSEIGARLSPRFRVGVVSYSGNGVAEFPLTEITSTIAGQPSAGLEKLRAYLVGLQTVGGDADVPGGVAAAVSMLRTSARSDSRQLLTMLGDASCSELAGSEAQHVAAVQGQVTRFAGGSTKNRVLSIFTGNDPSATDEIGFFKGVAGWAGQKQGTYTDDISQLSASVIEALFSNKE